MATVTQPKLFAEEPKLFGKWNYDEVVVANETIENFVAVKETKSQVFVPHTAGRYQLRQFKKATMPIVERLVGGLQFHGRNTGKKLKAIRIVK